MINQRQVAGSTVVLSSLTKIVQQHLLVDVNSPANLYALLLEAII